MKPSCESVVGPFNGDTENVTITRNLPDNDDATAERDKDPETKFG